MTTLHLVNHSPAHSDALASCLNVLRTGDSLLLLEDGVFAIAGKALEGLRIDINVFVLTPDVEARGLTAWLGNDYYSVNYDGFVDACAAHDRIVTWS